MPVDTKIKSSETVYGLNDFRCLFRCHAGADGQGKLLAGKAFRDRERQVCHGRMIGIAFLTVRRYGIMDKRRYASRRKMVAQTVTLRRENGEDVPHVLLFGKQHRQ